MTRNAIVMYSAVYLTEIKLHPIYCPQEPDLETNARKCATDTTAKTQDSDRCIRCLHWVG